MHVNVVGETAVAGRRAVRPLLFQQTEAHRLAVDVGVVLEAEKHLEAKRFGEERQGPPDIADVHERRDLDKVRQGAPASPGEYHRFRPAGTPPATTDLFGA